MLESIKELPSEFECEELIEKLIFIEIVVLVQSDKGEAQTHEAVKQIVHTWRK